jgi:bifunctional non-homologous end joining protein LigD
MARPNHSKMGTVKAGTKKATAAKTATAKAATAKAAPRKKLAEYAHKRDFARTPEPTPQAVGDTAGEFVVQKHAARRLHYDLRLELDGVLKSWAVTRGPSLTLGEKRLAVRTEDHPIEYLNFEGNIPKGEYGGGSMIVWDRGRWTPVGDPTRVSPRATSNSRSTAHGSRDGGISCA